MKSIRLLPMLLIMLISTIAFSCFAQSEGTELPSIGGFVNQSTLPTIVFVLIGTALYFAMRFRIAYGGSMTSFSFAIWFDRNWLNVLCYVVACVFIYLMKVSMSPMAAIALGAAPNLLIDWIQREIKIATGG